MSQHLSKVAIGLLALSFVVLAGKEVQAEYVYGYANQQTTIGLDYTGEIDTIDFESASSSATAEVHPTVDSQPTVFFPTTVNQAVQNFTPGVDGPGEDTYFQGGQPPTSSGANWDPVTQINPGDDRARGDALITAPTNGDISDSLFANTLRVNNVAEAIINTGLPGIEDASAVGTWNVDLQFTTLTDGIFELDANFVNELIVDNTFTNGSVPPPLASASFSFEANLTNDTTGFPVFSVAPNDELVAPFVTGNETRTAFPGIRNDFLSFVDFGQETIASATLDAGDQYTLSITGDERVDLTPGTPSTPNGIPEPSAFILGVLGLLGLSLVGRRRRRR